MAQRPRTHSPQPTEPEAENFDTAHPLMRHSPQVDNFLKAAEQRKQQKEFQIEELELWKDAVIGLAASPNGRLFLKSMIQFSGYFEPVNTGSAQMMIERAIKASFYLKWVKPFLSPELRSTIE